MSVINLQQKIQNRQLQIYNFAMLNYDADKFADWLTDAFEQSSFKSFSALADKAGLSRSTVSALAGSKKQSLTDKPSQPKIETVIELAKALNKNLDEARLAAGYAPENSIDIPDSIKDAFEDEGKLSMDDEILIASFIKMLKQHNKGKGVEIVTFDKATAKKKTEDSGEWRIVGGRKIKVIEAAETARHKNRVLETAETVRRDDDD